MSSTTERKISDDAVKEDHQDRVLFRTRLKESFDIPLLIHITGYFVGSITKPIQLCISFPVLFLWAFTWLEAKSIEVLRQRIMRLMCVLVVSAVLTTAQWMWEGRTTDETEVFWFFVSFVVVLVVGLWNVSNHNTWKQQLVSGGVVLGIFWYAWHLRQEYTKDMLKAATIYVQRHGAMTEQQKERFISKHDAHIDLESDRFSRRFKLLNAFAILQGCYEYMQLGDRNEPPLEIATKKIVDVTSIFVHLGYMADVFQLDRYAILLGLAIYLWTFASLYTESIVLLAQRLRALTFAVLFAAILVGIDLVWDSNDKDDEAINYSWSFYFFVFLTVYFFAYISSSHSNETTFHTRFQRYGIVYSVPMAGAVYGLYLLIQWYQMKQQLHVAIEEFVQAEQALIRTKLNEKLYEATERLLADHPDTNGHVLVEFVKQSLELIDEKVEEFQHSADNKVHERLEESVAALFGELVKLVCTIVAVVYFIAT